MTISLRLRRTMAALLALGLLLALGGAELALAARCLTPDLPRFTESYAQTRALLEAQGRWQVNGDPARTPPPNPQVGDTWLWYIWDLGGFPVANLKPCTVRGMGPNVYVVVDDDEWNVSMDQTEVDRIVDHFENVSVGNWPTQGVWELNTGHFGDPPNPLDNLDRIFLLYYRFNISSDGFFWVFDQFPDGSQAWASNEADVVYMATDSGLPASDYMIAVAAHEFEHMIHFARDSNEDSWLDEGLGELAMWLFGNPDVISSFNTNPDNNLIDFAGGWADYIQTYLWSLYAYEQLGGQPFIWDLIHNPINGMNSYASTMASHGISYGTDVLFQNWAAANFLDDPTIPNGEYGYLGDDLPAFSAWRTHGSYPASSSGSVNGWAAEYIRCTDVNGVLHFEFNGVDTRDFRVMLLGLDATLPTLIESVPLDAAQDGTFDFTAAQGYDEVIVTVANISTGLGGYSYSLDLLATGVPADLPAQAQLLGAHPNPFNPSTKIAFALDRARDLRLRITDAAGRQQRLLLDETREAGEHSVRWDGRDDRGRSLPSGVYFVRLEAGRQLLDGTKLVLLK